ncbi:MAG TPA: cytochrome c biogenesis protein CcsA [Candidatus Limnocylindria bacterium]|nr:cytochrome c biogenesis protein CcsA [Candidatus Limnocylindria bacterium]
MGWLTDRLCFGTAVAFYGIATVFALLIWRRGFRRDNHAIYALFCGGLAFHTGAMLLRGFSLSHCPISNLYEAIVFVEWTIAATYVAVGCFSRFRFLGAFAAPLLATLGVFALMPPLDRKMPTPHFETGWSPVHAALILLAYGAFGLGSLAALMYLSQEHNLRFNKSRAILALFPPITRLEKAARWLLFAGMVFLTGGLVTGALYLHEAKGIWFVADPFILYSLLTWVTYVVILLLAWRFGQSGRRFAWSAVVSFVFVMLTFWGIFLLSGLHNQANTGAVPS